MTETELHQAVQQWQNGNKSACWQVSEWLWQRQNAAAVRFVYTLLDPQIEDYDRMQQAEDVANDAFWAAMEELDLKVSGGKLLVSPTGHQEAVKGEMRALFLGAVSERELSARKPLEWRGVESFAALLWRIWLRRCNDAMRGKAPPPIRFKPIGQGEERTGMTEEELPSDLPDSEMGVMSRENVRVILAALKQITQQLRKDGHRAEAEVGDTLLRYAREQLPTLSVDTYRPDANAADPWKFVQHTLELKRDAAYQRKRRFLKAMKDSDSPQASVLLAYLQTKHEER